ncbi:hypothetical protein H4R34_002688 [Dimargaris verticillata]|uniref:U1-type domain-containing protein n=1 Tax=Dimargaris verticillata TaxID=2761393 RepID=A0A9W8EDV0_9FUNG|nr:hypothetical protein H4R34_002688 [Dimargaris verticillata]
MAHQPLGPSRGSKNPTPHYMPTFSYQSVADNDRSNPMPRTAYYCNVCSCRVPEAGRKLHDAGRRHKQNLLTRNETNKSSSTNHTNGYQAKPKAPSTTKDPRQVSGSPVGAHNANDNKPLDPPRSITGANLSDLKPLPAGRNLPLLGASEIGDLPRPAASTRTAPSAHQPFKRSDPWALDYGRILAAAQSLQPN